MEGKMHPILVKIGPLTIQSYGFLLALGVLLGFFLSLRHGKKENIDLRILSDFIVFSILIGLIGAKLWLLVSDAGYYLKSMDRVLSLATSGGTFFGGLIFGILFSVWYLRKYRLDFPTTGDALAPSIALAHFFGRLGCFAAGCCWGRSAEGCSVAVTFTDPHTTTGVPHHVPLYPTQLAEALLNLVNFIVLMFVYRKKKYPGQIFALYVMNYSIIRFFVEFFRGDHDRRYIFGNLDHPFTSMSVPQLVCILGFILAIILFKRFKKRHLAHNG